MFGRDFLFTPELRKAMKAEIPKVLERAGELNDTFWMNHAAFKKWEPDRDPTQKRCEREKKMGKESKGRTRCENGKGARLRQSYKRLAPP